MNTVPSSFFGVATEDRLKEKMLVVDAVCEAISQFGEVNFARSVPDSVLQAVEQLPA